MIVQRQIIVEQVKYVLNRENRVFSQCRLHVLHLEVRKHATSASRIEPRQQKLLHHVFPLILQIELVDEVVVVELEHAVQ